MKSTYSKLYSLPEEWSIVKISDVSKIQGGYAFKSKDYINENGIRLLKIANVSFSKIVWDEISFLPIEYKNEFKDYQLHEGDVVMPMTRPVVSGGIKVARITSFDTPCILNQRVCRFITNEKIVNKFLFFNISTEQFIQSLVGGALGSHQPNISASKIGNIEIPLPPLPEQRNIAFILSTVQEAIEKTTSVIQATKELKKSMMKHLFTYGPVPITEREKVQLKETEIVEIPKEWKIVKLENVAHIIMGQSPPGSSYNTLGEGTPFLQGKAEFGILSPKHNKYTTDPKKLGKDGSVLMSVRAPVGDVNLANMDYCIGRGLSSISMKKGNNIFLFYLLNHLKPLIQKEGTGSTFKAITKSKLTDFLIMYPENNIQVEISNNLMSIEEKIQKEKEKKNKLNLLFKSFLKNLMTGKIRVKDLKLNNLQTAEMES